MPPWLRALHEAPACDSFAEAQAFARSLRARYKDDAEFQAISAAVLRWQTDFTACAEIHAGADAWLSGGTGTGESRSLLQAVAAAGSVAPELYRGFAEPLAYWEVVAEYVPGSDVDLPLVSFTSEYARALEFAWLTQEAAGGTEVVFLLREGANAVRIELLAPDAIHWREREWLSGGRFRVTAVDHPDAGRVEVHLVQEGYYDVC